MFSTKGVENSVKNEGSAIIDGPSRTKKYRSNSALLLFNPNHSEISPHSRSKSLVLSTCTKNNDLSWTNDLNLSILGLKDRNKITTKEEDGSSQCSDEDDDDDGSIDSMNGARLSEEMSLSSMLSLIQKPDAAESPNSAMQIVQHRRHSSQHDLCPIVEDDDDGQTDDEVSKPREKEQYIKRWNGKKIKVGFSSIYANNEDTELYNHLVIASDNDNDNDDDDG